MSHCLQDLSSSIKDKTQGLAVEAQSPNNWTATAFQFLVILVSIYMILSIH